jgi:hypothetical protein
LVSRPFWWPISAVDAADAADQGRIVGVGAIAGELFELLAEVADVVQRVGTQRMARQLGHLPGRELAENLAGPHLQLVAQLADLFLDVESRAVTGVAELGDLGLQLGDRLFEVEEVLIHGARSWAATRAGV